MLSCRPDTAFWLREQAGPKTLNAIPLIEYERVVAMGKYMLL
ncbi:hypothetical protein ADU37_CDS12990 [Thermococcus sp. 2319x1]|nr:hypothetical protein [Thermococcus sp. 2319x1]ALV62998.1 hypothetical protein ADU37_CDS12990 [Thermococcus sp. 2319x1]